MRFWQSIVTRSALFFTMILVTSILISGLLVFRRASRVITENTQEQLAYSSELAEQGFYGMLREVSNDISVIISSVALKKFMDQNSSDHEAEVNELFSILLENKPSYFQIRLIDTGGKEVIRFNKDIDGVTKTPPDSLQDKGLREYFREAINTGRGQFYYSRINLNEERGVISDPQRATLRAATTVYDNTGRKFGIVVINVDLAGYYEELDRIAKTGPNFYLVDSRGQYLYHRQDEKMFGEQRNTGHRIGNEFQTSIQVISANIDHFGEVPGTNGQDHLIYVRRLSYPRGQQNVYLISEVDEGYLFSAARQVRKESFTILLAVCAVSLLLVFLFARIFSARINQITKAIVQFDENSESQLSLPLERTDEIGMLARSFDRMRQKIDQHVHDLNLALSNEKRATIQKDEFLQNMSHELRTPLHTINGLTQLLEKNDPLPGQIPIIRSLQRSARMLSGLVSDILDHQKLTEGQVQIEVKAVDVAKLLEEIYGNYQFDALRKGLDFSCNIDENLKGKTFLSDPLRLSQIIMNLVVNAIKFTEEGRVVIHARKVQVNDPMLEIMVEDTGIGIEDTNLEKINERFFQEINNDYSGRQGYGLGLSIVRHLVALFGGTFNAQSEKSKGSVFTVRIPLIETHINADDKQTHSGREKLPDFQGEYHIAHIDDDPSSLDLLQFNLSRTNVSVHSFKSFSDFARYISSNSIDLLISDLMVGDYILDDDLEKYTEEGNTPVIIVSASEMERMLEISSHVFQKPFDTSLLVDKVNRILGRSEYDNPDFESIRKNYDYNPDRVNKVLSILETEIKNYLDILDGSASSYGIDEYRSVAHKAVTHARDLKMNEAASILSEENKMPSPERLDFLRNDLLYCLCCIRVEKLSGALTQ